MGSIEHIKRAKERSNAVLEELRSEPATYEGVYERLHEFIRLRYLSTDGFWSDDVNQLAEHSIELRLAALEDGGGLGDLSMNCAGASSVETKYALLLITLRKSLDLTIEPRMAATLDTVPLLAAEVTRQLAQRARAC